jgi:DHA1 family tetracycline resistance protein-like MFS transporter
MGAIQGGGMKALSKRYSERALVSVGTMILAAGFVGIVPAPSVAVLLVPLLVLAVGRAIAQPAMMSLASAAADPSDRGAVMGTFQSAASLARVFGPVLAGLLYDVSPTAPFVLASALVLGVTVAARGFPERASDAARGAVPLAEA